MSGIAERLRERTTLRYMGDCKCGKCQLVPRDLLAEAADENEQLLATLKGLLHELDTDDIGGMVEGWMEHARVVIAKAEGHASVPATAGGHK